jgi:hypothetical protein
MRRAGTVEVDTHLERKPSLLSVVKLSSHTKLKLQYLLFIRSSFLQGTHYRAVLRTLVLYEVPPKDIYKCLQCSQLHFDLYHLTHFSDVTVSQTWMSRCPDSSGRETGFSLATCAECHEAAYIFSRGSEGLKRLFSHTYLGVILLPRQGLAEPEGYVKLSWPVSRGV